MPSARAGRATAEATIGFLTQTPSRSLTPQGPAWKRLRLLRFSGVIWIPTSEGTRVRYAVSGTAKRYIHIDKSGTIVAAIWEYSDGPMPDVWGPFEFWYDLDQFPGGDIIVP